MFSLSCGRPKNTRIFEEEYVVNKILARRVVRQRTDYLIAWEGYDQDGDTFEPKEHLPLALIVAFDAYMATLPSSFDIVLRQLRDGFARKLLESNGPMFGVEIEVEMAALPEYADALLAVPRQAQVVACAAPSALLAEVRLLPHPRSSRCDSPPPPPNPHRLPCLSRALEPHDSRGARLLPQLARSGASPRRTYAAPPACSGGTASARARVRRAW